MAEPTIGIITDVLQARKLPTITMWNRLEGRPRADDFSRTLKAEIRDPLWMLTRQWQMGEFRGDDAGSPVFAKIHLTSAPLTGYQPASHDPREFDLTRPLEAQVEARSLPLSRGDQPIALDIRLAMGRQWLKYIRPLGVFKQDFVDNYPVLPPDPNDKNQAEIVAHRQTWQAIAAAAGRAVDGYALYVYLRQDASHHAYDGTTIPPALHLQVDDLAAKFMAWYERIFYHPGASEEDAWLPSALEYQFSLSSENDDEPAVLLAKEYHHGRLDWYNLDIDPERTALKPENNGPGAPVPASSQTSSFIPTQVTFDGMPHTRWWTFEDGQVNFGDVNPGTKDLAQLMLIEFGLIYANDWFLFPLTLPVGSLTRVKGLAVTNVFGERIWVEAAGRGQDEAWQRWNMFSMAVYGQEDVSADTRLLLLPTVPKIQQGSGGEAVTLVRDEMANMVWGIETRVSLPDGRSVAGLEAAQDLRRFYERLVNNTPAPPPPDPAAPIRYQVMSNNVPENWIPFIPVHIPGSNREIQLQRAALPRLIARDPERPAKIRPRTTMLREGLDARLPYFVHEEEVPRAGVQVTANFQRTRWSGGQVVVWYGIGKQTGRGEASSNLRYDQLLPLKMTNSS